MWFFSARGCSGRVPVLILGVLGTLLGRILRRFSTILCVVLRPDSGPSFAQSLDQRVIRHRCLTPTCLVRPSYLWCWQAPRGGVMKMMHFLRCTAHWLVKTVCYTVRFRYVRVRLHHQDWMVPSSAWSWMARACCDQPERTHS